MWKMYIRSANFASCDVNSIGAQHATKAAWYVTCNSRDCCASEMACAEKVTDLRFALSGCDEQVLYVRVCLCVCLLSVIRLLVSDDTTKVWPCELLPCMSVCVRVCDASVSVPCFWGQCTRSSVHCTLCLNRILFALFFLCSVYTHTRNNVCTNTCEQSCSYCKQRAVVVVVYLKWLWAKEHTYVCMYIALEFWQGEFD